MGCAPSSTNQNNQPCPAAEDGGRDRDGQGTPVDPTYDDDFDERATAPHEQDRNDSLHSASVKRRRKSLARKVVEIGDYSVVMGRPAPNCGNTFIAKASEGIVKVGDEEMRVMVKLLDAEEQVVKLAAEAQWTTPANIISTLRDYQLEMQQVQHANLCEVITTDVRMHTLRVTTAFVEGNDVSSLVSTIHLDILRNLLRDLLGGLTRLHSHSLAHGNVKPENIILDRVSDQFVLLDGGYGSLTFHIERLKLYELSNVTFQGYYPPESLTDMSAYRRDEKLDISVEAQLLRHQKRDSWAVGVLTYLLVFGVQPFQEGTVAETFHRICEMDPIVPPQFVRPGLAMSANLRDFILQLLQRDPDKRPSLLQMLRHPFLRRMTEKSAKDAPLIPGAGDSNHASDSNVFSLAVGPSSVGPGGLEMFDEVQVVGETFPCSVCLGSIVPLAFQCTKCSNYVMCSSCYRIEQHRHDPTHHFTSIVVEEMSDQKMSISFAGMSLNRADTQEQLLMSGSHSPLQVPIEYRPLMDQTLLEEDDTDSLSFADNETSNTSPQQGSVGVLSPSSSRQKSQLVLINTKSLSAHEQTVFSMTGQLPESRLEVAKKASMVMRQNSFNSASKEPSSNPEDSDDDAEVSVGEVTPKQGKGSAAKTLIGMAPPEDEYSVEEIVEECALGAVAMLLNGMKITVIPLIVYEPPLEHVVELDLSSNNIQVLPSDIANLMNLRKLMLGNNELTELPDSIGDLTDLEVLEVHHNKLTDLPQTLMFADSLTVLAMDYNECPSFPAVILDMPSLETVYLASNTLIKAWPSIDDLKALGTITIGIDNEPHLFSRFQSMQRSLPGIKVMWNKIYPDMIIQGMYCGSLRSAQTPLVYEALKIKHILSMGRGLEPVVLPGMRQLGLNVDDIENANIEETFDQAVDFIDRALSAGEGCLVHCFAGMSRSATACIAYLMIRRGMRLDEAYVTTKRGRPAIYPNQGFFKQLLKLDAKLFPSARPLDVDSMERDQVPMG